MRDQREERLDLADIRDAIDRIIHDYFRVDLRVVWDVVEHDLPPLREQLDALLSKA